MEIFGRGDEERAIALIKHVDEVMEKKRKDAAANPAIRWLLGNRAFGRLMQNKRYGVHSIVAPPEVAPPVDRYWMLRRCAKNGGAHAFGFSVDAFLCATPSRNTIWHDALLRALHEYHHGAISVPENCKQSGENIKAMIDAVAVLNRIRADDPALWQMISTAYLDAVCDETPACLDAANDWLGGNRHRKALMYPVRGGDTAAERLFIYRMVRANLIRYGKASPPIIDTLMDVDGLGFRQRIDVRNIRNHCKAFASLLLPNGDSDGK